MKKWLIPLVVVLVVVFLVSAFFALRPARESISLSISSMQNQASALAAVMNEPETVASAPAPTYAASGTAAPAPSPNDPISVLRTIPEASTFVSLLEQTGVVAELSPNGTYTFFVPTNAAFASSPLWPLSRQSAAYLRRLAEFHIVPGKMMSVDSLKVGFMTMLSRDDLNANVFEIAQVGGNTRIVGTYQAPDGIVYLIDHVLLPPQPKPFPF